MVYQIQYGGMMGGKTMHYKVIFEDSMRKPDFDNMLMGPIELSSYKKEEMKAIRSLYRRR